MIVVAIVGHPSSGKDTVSEYLVTRGFSHVSSSDRIREDMRKAGIETTRENMNEFSAAKRQENLSYPADEIAEEISRDTVISGLRNTAEIALLKEKFGDLFALVALHSSQEIRFGRVKERGRIGDGTPFEQFQKIEEKERGGTQFHEVDAVIGMADYQIENSGTKEELFQAVDAILEKLTP